MAEPALSTSQLVVAVCLFVVAAIAMLGGALQFVLGQPDTSPRLDNVHRFMAGVYFSTGLIALWAGLTVRQQAFLVYFDRARRAAGGQRTARVHRQGRPAEADGRVAGLTRTGARPAVRPGVRTPRLPVGLT